MLLRLTYYFGQLGIDLRNHKLNDLESGNLSTLNILKDQRVVIAVDGGRTRIRMPKKGKREVKTNRYGFAGEWMEPKVRLRTNDKLTLNLWARWRCEPSFSNQAAITRPRKSFE